MNQAFLANPLLSVAAFLAVYLSDYYLTMHAARLYRTGANEMIVLEGSYELNPMFISDVDRLRRISPRFIALLALYSLLIWVFWYLSARLILLPQLYAFFVGAVLLIQGPIHVRHVRNIVAFRHAKNGDGISGRIEYARRFSYTASAVELLAFSAVYFALALLSGRWLLVGGAFACTILAVRHYRSAMRAR